MILPIVAYGNKILRDGTKDLDVESEQDFIKEVVDNLKETLNHVKGLGLSAPQVNLPFSVFILKDGRVFINPYIESSSDKMVISHEGCLSIPNVYGTVKRHQSITVSYFDEELNEKTEEFSDLDAIVIQHEYDHLEGILFIDLLSTSEKPKIRSKLKVISRGNITPEYDMIFKPKKK